MNDAADKDDDDKVRVALVTAPTAVPVPAPTPEEQWFLPEEVAVLDAQPVSVSVVYDELGSAPRLLPAPAEPGTATVLEPADGAVPVIPGAFSAARVARDSINGGIKSSDDSVLCSREEVARFFNFHNTRPRLVMVVHGYHHRRDTGARAGRKRRRVSDFRYNIDLTEFIFPFGKIVSTSASKSAMQTIDEYLADTNRLKSLKMNKRVLWSGIRRLETLVADHIRSLGWHRQLRVTTVLDDRSVRICTSSRLAKAWDSRHTRFLSALTVIPALALGMYGQGHRDFSLVSTFAVKTTPQKIFRAISSQLHCGCRRRRRLHS